MDAIRVVNLSTGEELFYDPDIGPRKAVICAYAQEKKSDWDNGDGNTWLYEERYGNLVVEGEETFSIGDFATLKQGENNMAKINLNPSVKTVAQEKPQATPEKKKRGRPAKKSTSTPATKNSPVVQEESPVNEPARKLFEEWREIKSRPEYSGWVVLLRSEGAYYETFSDHAQELKNVFGVALAGVKVSEGENLTPMGGVNIFQKPDCITKFAEKSVPVVFIEQNRSANRYPVDWENVPEKEPEEETSLPVDEINQNIEQATEAIGTVENSVKDVVDNLKRIRELLDF